VNASAVTVDQQ